MNVVTTPLITEVFSSVTVTLSVCSEGVFPVVLVDAAACSKKVVTLVTPFSIIVLVTGCVAAMLFVLVACS